MSDARFFFCLSYVTVWYILPDISRICFFVRTYSRLSVSCAFAFVVVLLLRIYPTLNLDPFLHVHVGPSSP